MFTVYYPLLGSGNQKGGSSSEGSVIGKQLTSKPSEGASVLVSSVKRTI